MDISLKKKMMREEIWDFLVKEKVARFPLPLKDRIPNFEGSEKAADLVKTLPEWSKAEVIFSNPDYAQKKIRKNALKEEKYLIMASPKLKQGFIGISPENVKGKEEFASTIKGAFKYGKILEKTPKPDLIITGCVAVGKNGFRLGKGGGYGDREIQLIQNQFGKIPVVTTVHSFQLVEEVPVEKNDTKVDIIVTSEKIIRVQDLKKLSK